MAFKKKCFYEIFGAVLVLSASLSTASGVDCRGKSFHCVNSTHFMICVDLGGGVSQSIDDFLIPCPPPTICLGTNHFECEFPEPTTPLPVLNVISETTQPWEDVVVTTNSPQRKTTKEYSEKYVNTESLSFGDSFTTDATVHTTEAPLTSASIDLNNRINETETVSTLPESNVFETTTTINSITESISIYGTTSNLDPVPQIILENITIPTIAPSSLVPQTIPENVTVEVTTNISLGDIPIVAPPSPVPQTIPESITTEVATEIPLVDIPTLAPFKPVPQTIPENVTAEVTTEITLVDIPTVEQPNPVPQTIPENITIAVATEIPLEDIPTLAPFNPVPQTIPENITLAVATEIPLEDIPTLAPFNPVPQTIPENVTVEVTTNISLGDIPTVAPPSPVPQTIPESITTEVATEIPLVDIPTLAPFKPVPQTIPENVTAEVTTEITLVDIPTVEQPNPVPQTISENITTEVETETPLVDKTTAAPPSQTIFENITTEVATEIPLVDIPTLAPFNPVPETIPGNLTTEVTTEISLVDIPTDALPSPVPQTISENITTEVTTEIPLVDLPTEAPLDPVPQTISENITTEVPTEIRLDVTTVAPITKDVVVETMPSTISANDSSLNIDVNVTSVPENTLSTNINSTTTNNNKQVYPETAINTNIFIGSEQVVTNPPEETYRNEANYLANNQFGFTKELVPNGPIVEQTTASYSAYENKNQPTTIGPEILTTDTTVNLAIEPSLPYEENPLNKLPTIVDTAVTPESGTNKSISTQPNGEEKNIPSLQNETNRNINNQEERKSTTESGVPIIPDRPTTDTKIIVSSQNKKAKDINQTIIDQEEQNSLPETGFYIIATETKLQKSTTVDLPTGENNVLANTIFDTVIVPAIESTESPTLTVSDGNFQTVANEIATETTISASNYQVTVDEVLVTEKSISIDDNSVIIVNPNLITEKDSKIKTAQFINQDQEVLVIENGYAGTEQPNINTFDNSVTTENVIYLPTDTSIITTNEGFQEGIQSLGITTEQPMTVTFDEQLLTVAIKNVSTERPIITTTNEQEPTQSNNENYLNKEKPIFVNNDNVAFGDSNSLKVINKTQEEITKNAQGKVVSTAETEYIPHGIVTGEPEIETVTTDSAIYKNALKNDQLTTVTGITTEGHPSIVSSTATAVEEVILTTDATVGVNQDKFVPPYDSVTTMATIANVSDTIHTSVKDIYDKLNIGNSPTWQDTAKGEAKEKSESVLTTDTATNSDSTTTDLNNSPLDGINKVIDSINTEIQIIGSNLNMKETSLTDTKETGIKLQMPSETTLADNQIITIDNTEVQDFIGTTENIYAINERGLKPIETVTIDDTNAIGQNTQDTQNSSSILNVPKTDNNIISQTNENNDIMINNHATNTPTDAVDTTISEGSLIGTVTIEKTVSSGNTWLELTNNNAINQQSQTTSHHNDNGTPNVIKNIEGSNNSNQISPSSQENSITEQFIHNSEQTNVAGVLGTDTLPDDKITTESNQSQTGSSGLDIMGNNIINQQSQAISQSIDNGILNVNSNVTESLNSQGNTDIDQFNNNLEQNRDAGVLETNNLQDDNTTTESYQGEISSSGLDIIENNIVNEISQTTTQSIDKGTSNILNSFDGSANIKQITSDPKANTITNQVSDDRTTTEIKQSQTNTVLHSELGVNENNNNQNPTISGFIDKGTSNKLNEDSAGSNVVSISVKEDKRITSETNKGQTSKSVTGLGIPRNNNEQSQITSGSIDKKTPNVLENIEGGTDTNHIVDSKTKIITNLYPQIIDNKSSNVVVTHEIENLHSTVLENSGSFATETKNIVNNPVDNLDVSSSSSPETDNKPKSTVLESVQSVLQTIGNFFNTASKNSSSATGHSDNLSQDQSNILPKDISLKQVNIDVTTESKTFDSTLFNNLQVSKAGANVPKLDVNNKRGSTESAPVNKHQTDESINIIRQVATVVPFDEASLSTNNDKDQVSHNVKITKPIISHISSGSFESISNNKVVPVVEPVSLDILLTETTKSGSSRTIKNNTRDSLTTIKSKVNKIEITAKPYKSVTSNPGTIISLTTTIPINVVQKSDASVVPKTGGISFVKQPEPTIPSISEKTIINGSGAGIGTVLANNNLNAKPNDHVIAQENTVHGSIPIQGAGNSVINGMNVLPSIDITSLFTDSANKQDLSNNGIISGLVSETAHDKKSSTYENNNAGIRNPSNVVTGNINENVSSNINQQNELSAQRKIPVNAVEKGITQSPIPIHATTSTGTVYPRNNFAAVVNNTTHLTTITNEYKNARANITGQINNQVTVAKKPVKSTTQASVRKTVPKPVSNVTENPKKQIVNNTLNFSCISGIRGRHSDKNDCRKFYICVGTVGDTQPIVGHCPVNTVFSDIKKQCTKNMSHCIRDNEFKCPSGGRFSDVINDNVYYICINHNSHLYRFKFQCQQGFTLNKTTVRCIENKEVESNESVSISSDSDSSSQSASSSSSSSISASSSSGSSSDSSIGSRSSTASSSSNTSSDSESTSSKSKKKKEKSESTDGDDDDEVFECEKEGKFRVKNDCKRYYLCKKNGKGEYRRKLKKCESGEVFHKKKRKCVDEDDYEC